MNILEKRARFTSHGLLIFALPIVSTFAAGILLGADTEGNKTSERNHDMGNVRFLSDFKQWDFSNLPNFNDLCRSERLLGEAIVKYVTHDKMPDPQYPSMRSGGRESGNYGPIPLEMYKAEPIAWSLKAVNIGRVFLPQLREEAIVLVHLSPQYFKEDEFTKGRWVLACLINKSRPVYSHDPKQDVGQCDSVSLWEIAASPELVSSGTSPTPTRMKYTPNIEFFRNKPTLDQVSKFVASTNFGNNDIFARIALSSEMEVDVLKVVVYSEYSKLGELFQHGISSAMLEQRKAAYREAFQRTMITPH